MGVVAPLEVEPKEHRKGAWLLFALLQLGFLVYAGLAIFLAARARRDPAVSIKYELKDTRLPDMAICPTITLSMYSAIKLANFNVACLGGVLNRPVVKRKNVTEPLNWDSDRTTDTTFQYSLNSACEVEATADVYPGALCFIFKLSAWTLTVQNISSALVFGGGSLTVNWEYITDMAALTQRVSIQRAAVFIVMDRTRAYSPGHQGMAVVGTGPSPEYGTISLIRKEKLDGTKVYSADVKFRPVPSTVVDPFPVGDVVFVSFGLNSVGTQVIIEQDPVNPTVLLSQIFAGWYFLMVIFGLFYSYTITRYSVIHQVLQSKRRKQSLSGKGFAVSQQEMQAGRAMDGDLYPSV